MRAVSSRLNKIFVPVQRSAAILCDASSVFWAPTGRTLAQKRAGRSETAPNETLNSPTTLASTARRVAEGHFPPHREDARHGCLRHRTQSRFPSGRLGTREAVF